MARSLGGDSRTVTASCYFQEQRMNFGAPSEHPQNVVTAEVRNGDGKPDMATPNFGSNTVSVLFNTSD